MAKTILHMRSGASIDVGADEQKVGEVARDIADLMTSDDGTITYPITDNYSIVVRVTDIEWVEVGKKPGAKIRGV